MKTKYTLIVLLTLATLSATASDQSADLKRLLGTWHGAAVEGDGSRPGSARARISDLTITPEKITARDGQGSLIGEGTFKLGREGTLLTIDATGTGGQTRGKSYQGVLLLEGDQLLTPA